MEDYEEGIPQLSFLLDSDKAFWLFRRFGPLSTRVLLHRQIELTILKDKIDKLDKTEAQPGVMRSRLASVQYKQNDWSNEHKKLIDEAETKLNNYCKCEVTLPKDSRI